MKTVIVERRDSKPTLADAVGLLKQAVKYLEHPDVQEIPFALPTRGLVNNIHKFLDNWE